MITDPRSRQRGVLLVQVRDHRRSSGRGLAGSGAVVVVVAGVYLLMRSRLGLALTAIRDDPTAAGSLGVGVTRAKRVVYVVAAPGCGLAGAMIVANTVPVQPGSIFSALQDSLADLGNWYLVVDGLVAIAVTLLGPQGLWGLTRGRVELFPTGHRVGSR